MRYAIKRRASLLHFLKGVPRLRSGGGILIAATCLLLSAFAPAIPAAAQSSARSLLAEAGAAEEPGFAGSKVKIRMPDDLVPPADAVFEPLAAREKIAKPELCFDATGKRAFDDGPKQPFFENWKVAARCGQNIADATVLEEKIADMKSNIEYLNRLLNAMGMAKATVDAATKLVGLQFIVIPLGGEITVQYKQVTGVNMQCVNQGVGAPSGPIVPVGRGAYTSGVKYIRVTVKQIKEIAKIRAEIKALSKKLNDSISKGEIGVWEGTRLGIALMGVVSATKENAIPLTVEAFEKYFSKTDKTHNLSFLFTEAAPDDLSKMPEGMRDSSGWPGWVKKLMDAFGIDANDLKIGTLALGDEVLKVAMVPEQKTLADTRVDLAKKIADFQKKKSVYEQTLQRFRAQLASLEKDGYGCIVTTDVAAKSEESVVAQGTVQRTLTTTRSDTTPSLSFNLTAATPAVTGVSAGGADRLSAGEMTLRAAIINEGGEIRQTFGNTIQYRDVSVGGAWVDWITFEVPGLIADGRAEVEHTWGGGVGEWEFRIVADSGSDVSESNEQDNYSEQARVSIVAREGDIAPPPVSGGAPKLLLAAPSIRGQQAGLGKIYAGSMTISVKVTNVGDGVLPPSRGVFQSAADGRTWNDWVRADVPRLGPASGHTISYNWNGGNGLWYFRFRVENPDGGTEYSDTTVVYIVPR